MQDKKEEIKQIIMGSFGLLGAFIVGFGFIAGLLHGSQFITKVHEEELTLTPEEIELAIGGPAPEDLAPIELIPGAEDEVKAYVVTKDAPDFPRILAKSFIVADLDSGDIIAVRNQYKVFAIASLTKLMTALVAEETLPTDEEVVVSSRAIRTYGEQGRLRAGEMYTVEELLYPLLLESSNDAAEVLAEHGGRESFMADMNAKAESLGLSLTQFDDPSGLSSGNNSTVNDLFALTQYIHKFRDYIFDITEEKNYRARGKVWYNNSRFRNDTYYIGGKNGFTEVANKTLIANFQLPLEGDNDFRNISIILLNSPDTTRDTRNIVSFLNKYIYYK